MEPTITVALIGGTGKAGKYLLQHLLSNNISVKLLHRNPDTLSIDHPLLQIIKGDARDKDNIVNLLIGCRTVISCLGQPVSEPPIFKEATDHIIQTMHHLGIQRYVLLAGLNVDTPSDQKGPQTQAATNWMKQHYPGTCADRQAEYDLLNKSDIDWTLVRIPLLIQTDEQTEVNVNTADCPGQQVSAVSLAVFLTDLATRGGYEKQAPFIADK